MDSLRKGVSRVEKELFDIYQPCQLPTPSLIVGWQSHDIGGLSSRVIHFLNEELECQKIAEIKPLGFFPLGGAAFKDDLIQARGSNFWASTKGNLLIFESEEPQYEWYRFLATVLDFAQDSCHIKDIYTISGTVSLIAHTAPRRTLAVYNQAESQEMLRGYGLEDMTWEGPPAISSYLLWVARRRGVPGVSLWPEIPFYLASAEDPAAAKLILSFLNGRFSLGLELGDLDLEARNQDEKIARLRKKNAEINKYVNWLESGLSLDEEEQVKLAREVYEVLKE
jgi:proteasome assembly chaperone (PAC2) family protein